MGRVHRFLGLTVGTIVSGQQPAAAPSSTCATSPTARTTSSASTTCATTWPGARPTWSRGTHFAIVDEVDSILIDEARTPLIISGPAETSAKWYGEFARIIAADEEGPSTTRWRRPSARSPSPRRAWSSSRTSSASSLYEAANTPLIGYLNNALKAKGALPPRPAVHRQQRRGAHRRRVHRPRAGRPPYNEGMHQAIEAKEKVKIKDENRTLATITLQNYFRSTRSCPG